MNAFNTISLAYSILLMGSICILFFTFRNKFDKSGFFFLIAEILFLPTVAIINLAHADSFYKSWFFIRIANATYLLAEILIFFSVYSLYRKIHPRTYVAVFFAASIFFGAAEFLRFKDPYLPSLVYPIGYSLIAFATYRICATCEIFDLKTNPFFNWLKYIEAALLTISLTRILGYFLITPVTPFDNNSAASLFLSIMAIVNISRYISYQSLRISWVGPQQNFLNRSLAQSAKDKEGLVENLINTNRLLGISALASTLAHELSQPLTSATLQVEAVKRDLMITGVDAPAVVAMSKVSLQLATLSEIVKNLRQLFAAKNEDFTTFSLQNISDEVINLVRATERTNSIKLIEEYSCNPIVHGNPVQIQQVLINIVNNAIEAIDITKSIKRQIRIVIFQTEGFARLTIEDSGPGIRDDLLPVIFDLYKTTKSDGLGIGLWLSKIIVDNHKGSIAAANKPEGGATFEIKLPLAGQTS